MASRSLLRYLRPLASASSARLAPRPAARAFTATSLRWNQRSDLADLKKGVADLDKSAASLMTKLEEEAKDYTEQARNHAKAPSASAHSIPPSTAGQVDPEGEVRDPLAGNSGAHGLPPPSHPSGSNSASAQVNGDSVPIGKVEPRLQLTFTCTAGPERELPECGHRSTHEFSKDSYENGIVLVQCPSCKARHLIADHLGWFKEITQDGKLKTLEDLMKDKGEAFKRGRVNPDGSIEFPPEAAT